MIGLKFRVWTRPLTAVVVNLVDHATLALVSFYREINLKMNIEHRTSNIE